MTDPTLRRGPVAVIGAGLAGLTAATTLVRRGFDVTVLESGAQIGGLAATHRDPDGFSYDVGAHFVTNRLAAALGSGAACRRVTRYGEAVLVRGRTYAYPFGLIAEPRYAASALRAKLASARTPLHAAEWFERYVGRTLAREIALPLVEAWSGVPAERLSPDVGATLPSTAHSLYLAIARRITGRPVASGYSRTSPEGATVWHVYPKDGVGTLVRALADRVPDRVELNSALEKIVVEDGAVRAVIVGGKRRDVSGVVSTLPLDVLATLVSGTDALQPLRQVRYRAMTFVSLRFAGRNLLRDVVLWTPDRRYDFFRLTEVPAAMPWLAPEGKTSVTADIGCDVGDAIWTTPDDVLAGLVLDQIRDIVPGAARRYLGAHVVRTRYAYPVFDLAYDAQRRAARRSLGVAGLLSVGRNGTFDHVFMEDVYWQTIAAAARFETAQPMAEPMQPQYAAGLTETTV